MFGLKDDYPLVAPNYAATRSALAKKIGLGRKPESVKPDSAIGSFQPRSQHLGVVITRVVEEHVDHSLVGISSLQFFKEAQRRLCRYPLAFNPGQP